MSCRGRRDLQAQGRDRDRHGPAHRRAAGRRQLAAHRRQRRRRRAGLRTQNRAVGFTYEPGSTFKAFTVAGALQDGTVTPDTPFDLAPQIQVADRVIGESHARGPVTLTTAQILAQSSNVGAITIGLRMGASASITGCSKFGFGQPTGVDLPGEERGLVLPRDKYSGSSMGNLPIGQGTSVTPMQMAQPPTRRSPTAGILRTPHVVRRVDGQPAPAPRARA